MIYSEKSEAKRCEQFILFLIQREEKKVHIDVTSSKEPSAVLRKHWRGDDKDTQKIFSHENPKAEPVMWLWDAGNLTRKKAKVFVLAWEQLFTAEGYEVVGSKISSSFQKKPPKLSGIEMYTIRKASVSGLLKGEIGWMVKCGAEVGTRLSPYQKFTTEPTEETLRIQVRKETTDSFRAFCDKEGLTRGQGLELLLAEHTGLYNAVINDLQEKPVKCWKSATTRLRRCVKR